MTANELDDSMAPLYGQLITVADLQRVLDGVATAVKAPKDLQRQVGDWITQSTPTSQLSLYVNLWARTLVTGHPQTDEEALQVLRLILAVAKLRHYSRNNIPVSAGDLYLAWTLLYDALTSPWSYRLSFEIFESVREYLVVPLFGLAADEKLEEALQLHLWLPHGQRAEDAGFLHSHPAFSQSWILAGDRTDYSYTAEATDEAAEATHSEYALQQNDVKQTEGIRQIQESSAVLVKIDQVRKVVQTSSATHSRDISYTIAAGEYHSIEVEPAA